MNKKELEDLVTKQQAQLARYKGRLADLVAAHKCLIKEKEVLEASLKAMSQSSPLLSSTEASTTSTVNSKASSPEKGSSDDGGGGEESDGCGVGSGGEEDSIESLKKRLTTLMNSIATLSEEKSRMEAGFQADKRLLRAEKLQLENNLKELNSRLEQEAKAHSNEIENFKSKLIVERHQREKEHNDHRVMIRELQKVVAEERGRRERAEAEVESLRGELAALVEGRDAQSRQLADLSSQLATTKSELERDKQSSVLVARRLQQQLHQLKIQHVAATNKEQERAREAEERARLLAAAHEERVANLEARLAELSQTVGQYDRLRQQDQIAIDKLKERLIQLEVEQHEWSVEGGNNNTDEKTDISLDQLIERLRQTVMQLSKANRQTSDKRANILAIVLESLTSMGDGDENRLHAVCQKEYDTLKQEFDNYRKQFLAQQLPSPRLEREMPAEIESYKSQVTSLKERIRSLHDQIEILGREHEEELKIQNKALVNERTKYRERLNALESDWRERTASLECELGKQRERAIALVKEKDQEIATLRESFHHILPTRLSSGDCDLEFADGKGPTPGGGGSLLYYRQEVARRDVELSRLRKEKHVLEGQLRGAKESISSLTAKQEEVKEALRLQVERFQRCQSRDGANLEYLKNVVLSYLLSDDPGSKGHMLNAIATVLGFGPADRERLANHGGGVASVAAAVTGPTKTTH